MYMSEVELEREGCPLTEDSIYRSVTLGRGQVRLFFLSMKVISVSILLLKSNIPFLGA